MGVVLVKEGQEDQKSIFKNESGSKEYLDFINSLGWPIDLNTHKGFLGGLESSSCGISAPYWADSNNEIIFHVGTKIPTIDSDPQQIQKVQKNITFKMILIFFPKIEKTYWK